MKNLPHNGRFFMLQLYVIRFNFFVFSDNI